jgi:hypothetical protein
LQIGLTTDFQSLAVQAVSVFLATHQYPGVDLRTKVTGKQTANGAGAGNTY